MAEIKHVLKEKAYRRQRIFIWLHLWIFSNLFEKWNSNLFSCYVLPSKFKTTKILNGNFWFIGSSSRHHPRLYLRSSLFCNFLWAYFDLLKTNKHILIYNSKFFKNKKSEKSILSNNILMWWEKFWCKITLNDTKFNKNQQNTEMTEYYKTDQAISWLPWNFAANKAKHLLCFLLQFRNLSNTHLKLKFKTKTKI